jgi:hypothetical protein
MVRVVQFQCGNRGAANRHAAQPECDPWRQRAKFEKKPTSAPRLGRPFGLHLSPDGHSLFFVHVEKLNGRPADLAHADNLRPDLNEMILPSIESWIEQFHHAPALGRNRGQVWPLLGVAVRARQRQVRRIVAPVMLSGSDVLDVKGEVRGGLLRQPAIFTSTVGPMADEVSRRGIHLFGPMRLKDPTRFALQKRNHVKDCPKSFVFGALVRRQRSFIRSVGEFVETHLVRGLRAQGDNFPRRFGREALDERVKRLFKEFSRAHDGIRQLSMLTGVPFHYTANL